MGRWDKALIFMREGIVGEGVDVSLVGVVSPSLTDDMGAKGTSWMGNDQNSH